MKARGLPTFYFLNLTSTFLLYLLTFPSPLPVSSPPSSSFSFSLLVPRTEQFIIPFPLPTSPLSPPCFPSSTFPTLLLLSIPALFQTGGSGKVKRGVGRREWEGAKEGVGRLKDPLNFYLCRVDKAFETWVRLSQINENVSTKRTGKSSNK